MEMIFDLNIVLNKMTQLIHATNLFCHQTRLQPFSNRHKLYLGVFLLLVMIYAIIYARGVYQKDQIA